MLWSNGDIQNLDATATITFMEIYLLKYCKLDIGRATCIQYLKIKVYVMGDL